MIYIIVLAYGAIYYSIVDSITKGRWVGACSHAPVFFTLVMVLSLQYQVGTDYWSYIEMALGNHDLGWIKNNNEYGFVWLNELVVGIGEPQLIFLFSALIQVGFLMLAFQKMAAEGLSIAAAFILYLILSFVFYNSMNGIRQYIAVYMFVYAFIRYFDSSAVKFIALLVLASLFHSSAIFLMLLVFLRGIFRMNIRFAGLVISYVLLAFLGYSFIDDFIKELISITQYAHYVDSDYFQSKIDLINVATKLPKILVVVFSAYLLSGHFYEQYQRYKTLINIAYFSTAVMIVSIFSSVLWRINQYFDFFTIIPLLVLLSVERVSLRVYALTTLLFLIFVLKVTVFAQGEYAYGSIF